MSDTSEERFAPDRLRCEYAANPLGIDERRPRLSWWICDPATPRGAAQTAYQIQAASSDVELAADRSDVWDSGKVESDQSIHVEYAGPPVQSRRRYHWRVRFWNAAGRPSEWSEPAWWEMGLLEASDYSARWIGASLVGGKEIGAPAPYLRKVFALKGKPASARLYVTALGLYEAQLNGQRVGEWVFTPGWTDYRRRVMVQAYDVTAAVRKGDNAVGAILGDGWACGHVGPVGRQFWSDRPKLLAQLEVCYDDGTSETIITDESWKTATGPILANDMQKGEAYDARLEMPGWADRGFDDSAWQPAVVFDDVRANLVASVGPRVREIQTLQPVAVTQPRGRVYVFDFGQNLVGRVRFRLRGQAGETVQLRHAEMLNSDGTIYTDNLREATSTDSYTFRADGEAEWEPRFTFHGFRYVELSGLRGQSWGRPGHDLSGEPTRDQLTAVVLHSDTPPTGQFECSHPLINQLQHNIVWGQKGNFLEVPTDCPQRNERLGWTGDIQVFVRTACFNMDVGGFMTKWLIDLADSQQDDGAYPIVAPDILHSGENGTAAWADAGVICPWILYLCCGDTRVLERHYESMVRFVEYMRAEAGEDLIRPVRGFGDWVNADAFTPLDMIATAYFAHSTDLLGRIAAVLGKDDDARKYRKLFEDIKAAFCREFVTETGRVFGGTQTAYIMALRFNLLPDSLRPVAMANLVEDIERGRCAAWPYLSRSGHLSTGFIGCKHINLALTEGGRVDVAYGLMMNEDYPSWLFPVRNGATTIWERWDGWTPEKGFQDPSMNSFNHYAFGAIGEWMYRTVAGIDLDEGRPGYKHAIIRPRPGGGLTHARGSLDSPYGRIECAWRIEAGQLHMDVTVPPNATATIHVPAASAKDVAESGKPLDAAEGVSNVRFADGAVVCEAVAGTYSFACPA